MITEETCSTAKSLLERLSTINQRDGTWIYRGQPDADKELLPTLFRDNCSLHESVAIDMNGFASTNPECLEDKVDWNKIQVALLHAYCYDLAHKLEKLLGAVGIPIPVNHNLSNLVAMNRGGIQRLFENYLKHIRRDIQAFGPDEIIHAYARHAGLPSVLLDWTYDYETAAFFSYFTDNDAAQDDEREGLVWVVNEKVIDGTDLRRHPQVNAATGQVRFMQKQKSMFLYDYGQADYFAHNSRWRTFDDIFNEPNVDKDSVFKLILPFKEKQDLQRFLTKRRVIKSQLMPTIYTAAEDVMSGTIEWLND